MEAFTFFGSQRTLNFKCAACHCYVLLGCWYLPIFLRVRKTNRIMTITFFFFEYGLIHTTASERRVTE